MFKLKYFQPISLEKSSLPPGRLGITTVMPGDQFPMLWHLSDYLFKDRPTAKVQKAIERAKKALDGFRIVGRSYVSGIDTRVQRRDPYFCSFLKQYRLTDFLLHKYRDWERPAPTEELIHKRLSCFSLPVKMLDIDRNMRYALARTHQDFKIKLISPPDLMKLSSVDLNFSTSAGFPVFGSKSDWSDDINEARWKFFINELSRPDAWKELLPCKVGVRRTPCPPWKKKIRVVWVYPMLITIAELLFAQPLTEMYMKAAPKPTFIGQGLFREAPSVINEMFHRPWRRQRIYNLDYSNFDGSVHPWLIKVAFSILKSNFKPNEWTQQHEIIWENLRMYFTHTPILLPNSGLIVRKKRGIPSGSGFTQLIGCIVNYLGIVAAGIEQGFHLHPTVLGDDSLFSLDRNLKCDIRRISTYLSKFDLTINASKSAIADYPHQCPFLSHTWEFMRANRRYEDLFVLGIMPETPVTSPGMSFVRISMLGLDTCDSNSLWWRTMKAYERWLRINFRGWKPEVGLKESKWMKFVLNSDVNSKPNSIFFDIWTRLAVWW